MKIGAQLYTVRDFIQNPEDIKRSMEKIAKIGYKSVQISAMGPIDAKELRKILDDNGLVAPITHTSPDDIKNKTDEVIERHKIIGARNVGIGWYNMDSLEGVKAMISEFQDAAVKIKDAGLQLCYHNHHFEFQKDNGKTLYSCFIEESDPELWGFIPDTYWFQYGGVNPEEQLRALKGRVNVCHWKDFGINKDREIIMQAIGEGNLNWNKIKEACDFAGIEYAMIEQDNCNGMDPFDALEISFKNIEREGWY